MAYLKLGTMKPIVVAFFVAVSIILIGLYNRFTFSSQSLECILYPAYHGPEKSRTAVAVTEEVPRGSLSIAREQNLKVTFEGYVKRHKEALENPKGQKFLYFKPIDAGLGNTIEALVTSFLFSILHNRTLVVELWGCGGMGWSELYSAGIELDHCVLVQANDKYTEEFQHLDMSGEFKLNEYDDAYKELDEKRREKQWLWADGQQDWTANFWLKSPVYGTHLEHLFTFGNVLGSLAPLLFKPHSSVLDATLAMESTFRPYVIGLQVRRVVPTAEGEIPLRNYINVAKGLQARRGYKDEETTLYLATDSPEVREAIHKEFKDTSVHVATQPEEDVFSPGAYENLRRQDVQGLRTALSEIVILSRCHDVVITQTSSFGALAAALGRKLPWYVTREGYFGALIADPYAFRIRKVRELIGQNSVEEMIYKQCRAKQPKELEDY